MLSSLTKSVVVGALALLVSLSANAIPDKQRAATEERIKPAGSVCVEGDADCAVATSASSGPRSGEDVYNASCMACHSTGAGGAPKIADAGAWTDRIGKGIDALYDSGINGVPNTGMMAMGTCMTCSEDEIKAAVDYMVDQSQ